MFFWYKDLCGFWRDLVWNVCLVFCLSHPLNDCRLRTVLRLGRGAAASRGGPFSLLAIGLGITRNPVPFYFIGGELAGDVFGNWAGLQKAWDFPGPTRWKLASHMYLTHCQRTGGALTQRQRHLRLIAAGDSRSPWASCTLNPLGRYGGGLRRMLHTVALCHSWERQVSGNP